MSDLNDDLLNYELGEDIDDHDLAGDEDELLLSDEETSVVKSTEKNKLITESEDWVNEQLGKQAASCKDDEPIDLKNNEKEDDKVDSSSNVTVAKESDVTTTKRLPTENPPIKPKINRNNTLRKLSHTPEKPNQNQKNDEVSSTIKDSSESNNSKTDTNNEKKTIKESKENNENSCKNISQTNVESNDEHSGSHSHYPSSDVRIGSEDVIDLDYSHFEGDIDEAEEIYERQNPKTSIEREHEYCDNITENEINDRHGRSTRNFQRHPRGAMAGRGGRYHQRGGYSQFYSQPNENYNPQQMIDYHQSRPSMTNQPLSGPMSRYPLPNDQMPKIAPPLTGPREDFRGGVIMSTPNFRPPFASDLRPQRPTIMSTSFEHKPGPQMYGLNTEYNQFRGNRPADFMSVDGMPNRPPFRPFNTNGPQGGFRPNTPQLAPRMDIMRPRLSMPGVSLFVRIQGPPRPQYAPGPPPLGMGSTNLSTSQGPPTIPAPISQPIMPRKVLINPNFKGGVEAATNQLMMDTMKNPQFINSISSHVSHLHSDEELLRQQEEFINKNRMHIEKRRYERSPDRDREYSPPRRERRAYNSRERTFGNRNGPQFGRGGRVRRANSRDPYPDIRSIPKRRRSESLERQRDDDRRSDKIPDDEDEETRAYRLEIEKQKAMREKILRDKEMRRKKAAEQKLKGETLTTANIEKKIVEELAPHKFTPLVVTESKIISLKKKSEGSSTAITRELSAPIQRAIPTAKILPETKKVSTVDVTESSATMAVVKPVMKKQIKLHRTLSEELDDLEEEELLAESSPSPSPPLIPQNFNPRRVVLKPSVESQKLSLTHNKTVNTTSVTASSVGENDGMKPKGIFDRLDRRIGVNEAAKRKIQRIVINNAETKVTSFRIPE